MRVEFGKGREFSEGLVPYRLTSKTAICSRGTGICRLEGSSKSRRTPVLAVICVPEDSLLSAVVQF